MIGVRCVVGSIVYLLRAKDRLWMMYDWSVCISSAGCKPKIVSSLYYSWFHINAYLLISFSPTQKQKGNIFEWFVTSQYKHSYSLDLGSWLGFVLVIFEGITIWQKRPKMNTIKAMASSTVCIPQKITFKLRWTKKKDKIKCSSCMELLQHWYLNPTTNLSLVNKLWTLCRLNNAWFVGLWSLR